MKSFLIKSLIFGLLVLAVASVGEVVVRIHPTPYSIKHQYITRHGEDVATLALGSSHLYYGFNPAIYGDSTFNLANISQTPDYNLLLLNKYLPAMPHLRRIIINMSYETFREGDLEDIDWRMAVHYKTQMGVDRHSDLSIYNFEICNFPGFTGTLSNMVLPRPHNTCDSLGFGTGYTLEARDPGWRGLAPRRVEQNTYPAGPRRGEAINQVDQLLKLAHTHGVEVVMVTTPLDSSFLNLADANQMSEMRRLADSIATANGVRYLDYSTHPSFDSDDFYDPDHLNDRGAAKLTRLLRDTL